MLHASEPPDVLSYRAAHPASPDETTSDQWFTEAQTESYRKLGSFTVESLCAGFAGSTLEALVSHVEST